VWYLAGSSLLGENARQIFDEAVKGESQVIVPIISLAELIMMIEKGRSKVEIEEVLKVLHAASGVVIKELALDVVLKIEKLKALPDIHDRLIVAEALANDAILITRDDTIAKSGLVKVIW
jgi:PIN domain nuclease of toxin-antitoxin system